MNVGDRVKIVKHVMTVDARPIGKHSVCAYGLFGTITSWVPCDRRDDNELFCVDLDAGIGHVICIESEIRALW